MRKIIVWSCLLLMQFAIKAQVLINLQLPQAGIHLKSQLWNMALVNTGAQVLDIKIDMTLSDISTGLAVLSGSSRVFSLSAGARQMQLIDLVPIQYNVLNNGYNVSTSPEGFLPVGTFTVCFSILKRNAETFDKIAEECETLEVEPASPPILNAPESGSETAQLHPLFSWLAPTPAYLFNNLSYEMKLTEIADNQNPSDAIQNNIPFFSRNYVYATSLQYPNSQAGLVPGKNYAWQVVANNNGIYAAKSEVGSFKISVGVKTSEAVAPAYYYKLLKGGNAAAFICDGFLKIQYNNEINDGTAQLMIYRFDKKGKPATKIMQESLKLNFNQNLIDLDLREVAGMKERGIYTIEIINSAGETWSGRFEFIPSN